MVDAALTQKTLEAVDALWKSAMQSEFAALQRVPSSSVKAWLAYATLLPESELSRLIEVSTIVGARGLRPYGEPDMPAVAAQEWKTHQDAVREFAAHDWWNYMAVRELKRAVGAGYADKMPAAVAASVAALDIPKAPELRKSIAANVAKPLALKPVKQGGGNWDYLAFEDAAFCQLHVDFGGMWAQVRYDVSWSTPSEQIRRQRANYERVLGIGWGDWDLIERSNCEASAHELRRLTETLFKLLGDLGLCRNVCEAPPNPSLQRTPPG